MVTFAVHGADLNAAPRPAMPNSGLRTGASKSLTQGIGPDGRKYPGKAVHDERKAKWGIELLAVLFALAALPRILADTQARRLAARRLPSDVAGGQLALDFHTSAKPTRPLQKL